MCKHVTKISSIYSWKGKLEDTSEFLATFQNDSKKIKTFIEKTQLRKCIPMMFLKLQKLIFAQYNQALFKMVN